MAEVLVLVDHVDGAVRKTTFELLTIARRLGEPSAVLIGAGFDAAKEALAQYGAEKIYRVESADVTDYLVAPKAAYLAEAAQAAAIAQPWYRTRAGMVAVAGVVLTAVAIGGAALLQCALGSGETAADTSAPDQDDTTE